MTRYVEWTLDSDDAAGGVTLDSDTILLDRQSYWDGNEEAKPTANFTKEAKPTGSWTPVEQVPIINDP